MDSGSNDPSGHFLNIFIIMSTILQDGLHNENRVFSQKVKKFNCFYSHQEWSDKKSTVVPSPHKHYLQTHNNRIPIKRL